jgi:hypothetical protein
MISEKQLNELSKEAELLQALIEGGVINTNSLKLFLKKIIELNSLQAVNKPKRSANISKPVNREEIKFLVNVWMEARLLQGKFNLCVPPHERRVLQYRRTQDPSVFDGLKRK